MALTFQNIIDYSQAICDDLGLTFVYGRMIDFNSDNERVYPAIWLPLAIPQDNFAAKTRTWECRFYVYCTDRADSSTSDRAALVQQAQDYMDDFLNKWFTELYSEIESANYVTMFLENADKVSGVYGTVKFKTKRTLGC